MAGEGDAKARFPRQEVHEGQAHGYLGDVEVYDPEPVGASNAPTAADRAAERPVQPKGRKTEAGGAIGTVTDEDTEQG